MIMWPHPGNHPPDSEIEYYRYSRSPLYVIPQTQLSPSSTEIMLILNSNTINQFAWINEIKQNVFCVRLLTLNIMFVKFIPGIACSSGLFTYFITMKLLIHGNIEDVYKIYYILIYKHITIYVSILLLMDIWDVSRFGLLSIMLL